MAQNKTVLNKIKRGLFMTHTEMIERVKESFTPGLGIDREVLDALEEGLLGADVGAGITMELMDSLESAIRDDQVGTIEELTDHLRREARAMIPERASRSLEPPQRDEPWIVLVVGVNGSGKTTTIAKLATRWSEQGKSILIGAADTFRAAAIEQLALWADRIDVPLIRHRPGADPGAVAHDTITAAKSRGTDVVLIDTAGRLHNKGHLMAELSKISRVIGRELPGAPHEVLLVIDGTTGQNGLSQAKSFLEAADVTGLVVTKLDGTAKGGVILSIMRDMEIPVYFIGVGESADDLVPFDAEAYLRGLFEEADAAVAE